MIFQALFKAFLIYIFFIFIRGLYRTFKTISFIKKSQHDMAQKVNSQHQKNSSKKDDSNTVEAEYKVLND